MPDLTEYLWVEKYRPKTLEELILPDSYRKRFKSFIADRQIPNLIFAGPPGSGKTTCARILCSPAGILLDPESNCLWVNGSAKESRGIDFSDETIKPFLRSPPSGDDLIRVVLVDEADNLTSASFKALRSMSEKYSKTSRFLFTCNYFTAIPDPIQSRLAPFRFKKLSKDFILDYCKKVLKSESVTNYDEKEVVGAINLLYPDVRKIINVLQNSSEGNTLKVDFEMNEFFDRKVATIFLDIISSFQQGQKDKVNTLMNHLLSITSEHELNYADVYKNIFDQTTKVPVKIIANKYCQLHPTALVPHMNFMSMVYESLQKLHQQEVLAKKYQGIPTYNK